MVCREVLAVGWFIFLLDYVDGLGMCDVFCSKSGAFSTCFIISPVSRPFVNSLSFNHIYVHCPIKWTVYVYCSMYSDAQVLFVENYRDHSQLLYFGVSLCKFSIICSA